MPVSVIIPVYNTGPMLRETVQSVLAQSWSDFELLLIDDGSREETRKIADSFTDPRIRVIHQENRGIAGARNRGIRESKGKYVAFLDHDDLWLPEKLAEQVHLLEERPEAGLCYSPALYFGDAAPGRELRFEKVSGWGLEALLRQNKIVSASSVMIRRSCLERCGTFDPECVPCDDWDLYLRIAPFYPILVTEKALIRYRLHAGNTSSDRKKMYLAGLRVLEKNRNLCSPEGQPVAVCRNLKKIWHCSYARNCYGLAWEYAGTGAGKAFFRYFFPAVFHDWTLWRAWLLLLRFPYWKLRKRAPESAS